MTLRTATSCLVMILLPHGAAFGQPGGSPVGAWKSPTSSSPQSPSHTGVMLLTISEVDASQRASGRFSVNAPGSSAGGTYLCPTGTVAGTFDGSTLRVASKGSHLCPERVWHMKLQGDELTGTYRGADGHEMQTTYTRR